MRFHRPKLHRVNRVARQPIRSETDAAHGNCHIRFKMGEKRDTATQFFSRATLYKRDFFLEYVSSMSAFSGDAGHCATYLWSSRIGLNLLGADACVCATAHLPQPSRR